jgi:hypothetical protein
MCLFALLALGVLHTSSFGQSKAVLPLGGIPTAGTEFLLCFENIDGELDTMEVFQDIYLVSSLDTNVIATITCRGEPLLLKRVVVPAHGSSVCRIGFDRHLMIEGSEVISNYAVCVKCPSPIVCIGVHHVLHESEGFVALPKSQAGYEYRAITYYDSPYNRPGVGGPIPLVAQFAVAAFEDSTDVEIVPACKTYVGWPAGTLEHYRLDAGQTVQIQTDDTKDPLDLTGSTIVANRPVAVYGAHGFVANVPIEYHLGSLAIGGTHAEALSPVSTWGKTFACKQIEPRPMGDIVRVLALNDNTVVRLGGAIWGSPLAANKFRDTLITGPLLIETLGPTCVVEYSHSGYDPSDTLGNDFLARVDPVEQATNDYSFYLSKDANFFRSYLNIATEISGKSRIYLDGTLISDTIFRDLPVTQSGQHFAVGTVQLPNGYHHIWTTNDAAHGFSVLAYGTQAMYDSILGTPYNFGGYGFAVNSNLRPLQALYGEQIPSLESHGASLIKLTDDVQENVVLDSGAIVLDSASTAHGYQVSATKVIGKDLLSITRGTRDTVELRVTPAPHDTVKGLLKVYHHTANWTDLRAAEVYFYILPTSVVVAANDAVEGFDVRPIYPNPTQSETQSVMLTWRASSREKIRVELVDAIGRTVGSARELRGSNRWESNGFATPKSSGIYYFRLSSSSTRRIIPFTVVR